ncbi:MAG: chemotaxis protein methyltransferase CheR [Frankiaceae bacterium]|nr:chemotaxis protein methyltransferase CheR [Frankiaceae bacterium]
MKVDMTPDEFDRLRRHLHEAAGLVFDPTRRDSLAYAIGERLPLTECPDVSSYLDLVVSPAGATERQALLDEVTIPETYFFRNPPQIRALRNHVLPALVKQATASGSKRIVVWSAGCSTGDEPYTIAMLLREVLPVMDGWDVRIIATDLSVRALAAARRGRYGRRSLQLAEPERVSRFFDESDGDYVVKDDVRRLVEFRHHNLVTDAAPFLPGEVDLVLCRNVTIYFDRETTRELMSRFHRVLVDTGYLFLGHAETLWRVTDAFRLVSIGDSFVYQRDDSAAPVKPSVLTQSAQATAVTDAAADRKQTRDKLHGVLGALGKLSRRHGDEAGHEIVVPTARTSSERLDALSRLAAAPVVVPAAEREPAGVGSILGALGHGQYREAVRLADGVLAAEPLHGQAHYLRGMALTNLGRDRDALVSLRKAVYLDSQAGFAHFLLASTLERIGERKAAARSYLAAAQALGTRPEDAQAAELGGRNVFELVALCRRLAGELADKGAS